MTGAQNFGGMESPVDAGGLAASGNSRHELDAVRRHICHILGFDYGLIDQARGEELSTLLAFSGEDLEEEYSIEALEDENGEPLTRSDTRLAQNVARSMQPYIGRVHLKRKPADSEAQDFPYIIVPIQEGFDQSRILLKGLLRLVSFDPGREIDTTDIQTLRIVAQHLSSRMNSLAEQPADDVGLGIEPKHVLLVHSNRLVRRKFSRSLSGAYRVSETDEVSRALENAQEVPVDVFVIDSEVKVGSGEPLFKALKQMSECRFVPLVVVTSENGSTTRVDALNIGADDVVDENCTDAELTARIRTLLRVRKAESELAMQLKLLEDYTQRLEQVGERERLASVQISRSHKELDQLNSKLREERTNTEIRRNQDTLLHKISDILRKSFNIDENVGEMLEHLSGWFQLDCCFVVLPSDEEPVDSVRHEFCSDQAYSVVDKDRDIQLLEIFRNNFSLHDDLFVSDVKRDKRIEEFKKHVLSSYHMYSLFYLPITYEEKLQGILGGHKCESEHLWSIDNQNFLRQVADQLSTALTNARLYKRVERQATTDGLTGLFNHRTGQEKLAEQLRIAERYQRSLSVVMIDVDHFKSINDTYGHPVGDTVLRTVAKIIKRDCRDVDIPVRYGGEEFLLVLPEINQEGALVVAERLRKTLNREVITHENLQLSVTASLGVASYPEDAETQHQLLELADKALYMSKRKGRNQVHSSSDLQFQEFKAPPPAAVPPAGTEPAAGPQAPAAANAGTPAAAAEEETTLVPEVVETVKRMAGQLYSRSEYNKVHHLETARFAEMVAKVLGLSQKQVEQIRVASLLHDVGLLNVPEDILNKQGQITAEELKVLMQHPTLGAEMLRHIPALKEICDILENHHECWDGTGYPRGLRGEEIPLAARIVNIVDAYHAMISDRPYRPAMSPEKARKVLKNAAGSQFDPFLVDIFLAVLQQVEEQQRG